MANDLADLFGALLDHPVMQKQIQRLGDRLDAAIETAPDKFAAYLQRRTAPQAPTQAPARSDIAIARAHLQFTQDELLTVEMVKTRKRELARRHHSDVGGDDKILANINAAAAILEKSLR